MKINKWALVILILGVIIVVGLAVQLFLKSGVEEIPKPPPLPDEVNQQTSASQSNNISRPPQNITDETRKSDNESVAVPKPPKLPQ